MPDPREPRQRLTQREREVLQQAALGLTNREIGQELQIAEQTVKNHLSSAMKKLTIRDRTSAVVIALGRGLISIPILSGTDGEPSAELVLQAPPEAATEPA